ncbi:hypothetical protein [Gottfriedia acidiceleris]|uniref:hypothetical protein n=1 Tax=Gottfriedia acidiceleris TaxID=371036 RepID=UPI003AF52E57
MLTEVVKQLSNDSILCIFHTHVANQIPVERKQSLLKTIEDISKIGMCFIFIIIFWIECYILTIILMG